MANPAQSCAECGVELNRHAEKVDFTAGLDEPEAIDPDLGGIVESFATCPACGKCVSHRS